MRKTALTFVAGAMSLSLVAAACGSDDSSSDTSAATTVAATDTTPAGTDTNTAGTDTSAAGSDTTGETDTTAAGAGASLGTPNKATGEPVTIGFLTDGKADVGDNSAEIPIAQAAASYVNDYLGGIGGHPIELQVCETKQTPAGAADCAQQFIDAKLPVVLNAVSGQQGSVFGPLQAAGIPYVMNASLEQDTILKPGGFVFTNGLAAVFAGPAGIGQAAGAKRGAIVSVDVPAAIEPVKQLAPIIYNNAGMELDIVAMPQGAADVTPQIQAEMANNPDQFALIGNVQACTAALQAIRNVGFEGTIIVIQQCIDSTSNDAVPGGIGGIKTLTTVNDDPTTPDYQLYTAIIDEYANGTDLGGISPGAYQVVMTFARMLSDFTGDLTPTTISDALKTAPAVDLPLAAGVKVKCDGAQIAITPNICSTGALAATYNDNGIAEGFTLVDTSALTKLG